MGLVNTPSMFTVNAMDLNYLTNLSHTFRVSLPSLFAQVFGLHNRLELQFWLTVFSQTACLDYNVLDGQPFPLYQDDTAFLLQASLLNPQGRP